MERVLFAGSSRLHRLQSNEEKAIASRAVEREVLPLVASGRITVPIAATYPLAEAAAAYDAFGARGKLGRILLLP